MVDLKVLKNSGIYTACNLLIKGMNFVLLPVYTAFLTTSDYGITGLMERFRAVMTVVCTFSLLAAVARFYLDYKKDDENLKRLIGTLYCFTFVSSVAFGLAICVLQSWIMPVMFAGVDFLPTMLVALVGMVFGNVYEMYQRILRGMERARLAAITSISYFAATAVMTIVFIIPLSLGANGVLLASLLSGVFFVAVSIASLCREGIFKLCIDWKILKPMLKYSIPLMPHHLSAQIAALLSSVLINAFGSLSSVGIYNIASKFGTVSDTVQSSVYQAYQPWLFRQIAEKPDGYKGQIVSFSKTVLWIYATFFVFMGLFIQEIVLLFLNESYAAAWPLIPFIIMVYSIKTIYYFYIGILFYHKTATKYIFVATLSASVLNVALSFAFIPGMGAYGSILADAISMVLRVGVIFAISKRFEDVGYRLGRFIGVSAITLATLAVGLFFSYTQFMYEINLFNLAWKVAVFLVFITVAYILHRKSIRSVAAVLMKRKGTLSGTSGE